MTSPDPQMIEDLQSLLENEEFNLEAARIGIDNEQRRQIEMERIRTRIDALKNRIAKAEAGDGN